MKKEFVTYEQASALRELGFDKPCFGYYLQDKRFVTYEEKRAMPKQTENCICAPTYSQAFRWFRDKYNILLDVVAYYDEIQLPLSKTNLQKPKGYFVWDFYDEDFTEETSTKFEIYEEAESACLDKLIEIVKDLAAAE